MRALAEAVKYAQWRRQAAVPGKVPEFLDDTIDEAGAAARIDALLGPDPDPRGRPLSHDEACELLGRYGITVRPTLPAPTRTPPSPRRLGSAIRSRSRPPHPICVTAPTSAVSGWTLPTRPRCAGPTAS